MCIPEERPFTRKSPPPPGENEVFRVHMHDDRVVRVSKAPKIGEETDHVTHSRSPFFLTQGIHRYRIGERRRSLPQTYDRDARGTPCKLLNPLDKEAEIRVIRIDSLGDNEE
jgi:hypothetical protein